MHTFHLISKKIIGLNEDSSIILDNIHKINFFIFILKNYSIENKYKFFNETIENIFYVGKINKDFLDYFSKIQKTYNAFSRLAFLYKYNKSKIMVNTDLIMNEINEKNKFVYCLFQNNYKYLFDIHELIKIINNSITNVDFFFNSPKPVKNPYNNVILNKSTLYNIYFFIRFNTLIFPELFYYYFKANFNLTNFVKKNQHILRNHTINTSVNNDTYTVIDYIDNMIYEYNISVTNKKRQINIDNDFPSELLINIMKPYLKLFLISKYSLLYSERIESKKLLKKKLYKFSNFNPYFGRKIFIKRTVLSNKPIYFEYNSKHISFCSNETNPEKINFMTSHTNNNEDQVDSDSDSDSNSELDQDIQVNNSSIFSTSFGSITFTRSFNNVRYDTEGEEMEDDTDNDNDESSNNYITNRNIV
jgi:hypothetical protein